MQIRRYETEIRRLLNNLAQHPDELRRWRDRDLHVLVNAPLIPTELEDYEDTRNRAAGMGFHIYPAFRTQPLQFADYVSSAFWQTNANRLINSAALRLPGDLWLGLDMENYSGPGVEPTRSALGSAGFSVAQLRAAMQPFIEALQATNASVALYPAGENSGEDLIYVTDVLGRERMELWALTTYPNAERYRRSSARGWPAAAAEFLRLMGQLQQRFPGYLVRPGINDLERVWADPYRRDLLRSGPAAPWGYDETRWDDRQFLNLGTPEHRDGTQLSALNLVRHVWPIQPMRRNVPAEFDTTTTRTLPAILPTALTAVGGEHTVAVGDARGAFAPSPRWHPVRYAPAPASVSARASAPAFTRLGGPLRRPGAAARPIGTVHHRRHVQASTLSARFVPALRYGREQRRGLAGCLRCRSRHDRALRAPRAGRVAAAQPRPRHDIGASSGSGYPRPSRPQRQRMAASPHRRDSGRQNDPRRPASELGLPRYRRGPARPYPARLE